MNKTKTFIAALFVGILISAETTLAVEPLVLEDGNYTLDKPLTLAGSEKTSATYWRQLAYTNRVVGDAQQASQGPKGNYEFKTGNDGSLACAASGGFMECKAAWICGKPGLYGGPRAGDPCSVPYKPGLDWSAYKGGFLNSCPS